MDLTEHVFQSLTADQQAAVIGKSNNEGTTDLYRVLRVIWTCPGSVPVRCSC